MPPRPITDRMVGGNATITSAEVTGLGQGSTSFTFAGATELHFDFNGSSSPTAAGFIGLGSGAANAYNATRGYGWQTASATFDRTGPTDLLRDGHFGTDNTFLVTLDNGNYIVNVTLGDSAAVRDLVDVYAEGVLVLDNVTAPVNQHVHRSFPVTISDGQLTLRFDDDGGDIFFGVNAIEILPAQGTHTLTTSDGLTIMGSGATAGSSITVSTSLGRIAPSTIDADPDYAGVQVLANGSGDFSFNITQPAAAGTATIHSEEVTALGAGSTMFTYAGLGPVVQIIDDDGNGTAVAGFSAPTFSSYAAAGSPYYQNDVKYTAGDNTGDAATWTFTVLAGGTYRVSATWFQATNRAIDAPYTISGVQGGPVTVDINQRVPPSDQAYTKVQDPPFVGTWFADLGVGATYVASGTTLTITLSDAATASVAPNNYVIADGVRVERLSPLHAEAATLGHVSASSSSVLTAAAARPVINQAIATWQLADPRVAGLLGNMEVIVSDLPQRVLGLASEASRTIWLDVNAAGHGWSIGNAASSSAGMDLPTVVNHEIGHLLGLPDLDSTEHAGDLMASRLSVGAQSSPLSATAQSLITLDIARPLSAQTRLLDDLFSSFDRGGLFAALTASTRAAFTADKSDSLLRTDGADDSLSLADDWAADLDRVVADRRLLSSLTSRPQLEREELDELFAHADELVATFEEKLLQE